MKEENPWNKLEAPHVEVDSQHGHRTEKITHPAFGCVVVSQWQSSQDVRFFGSDLGHRSGITLRIETAQLNRDLSRDWHFGDKTVCEFEMSLSQWARLVSSIGQGGGVPITLRCYPNGEGLKILPRIAAPELSKKEKHGEEMAHALKDRLERIRKDIDALGSMIEEGKISKKELRELHKSLRLSAEGVPNTVQFIYDQFAEATEHVVNDAKTEVEAHIDGIARKLGYDSLREMAPRLQGPKEET